MRFERKQTRKRAVRTEGPRTLGKYEIQERIGGGAFGVVYRAFDPLIRRPVAIKTCEAQDPQIRARFAREAQIAGKLSHANITTIFDFQTLDGVPFIVQEYLGGRDLNEIVETPVPMLLSRKVRVLDGVAAGLEYAHAAGVIHRDIKPANIRLLDDEGAVKIMDFGIAKSLSGIDITRPGVTVGSSAYMSPEQIRDETLDARTDLFSLGVMAYELLAYRRPFSAKGVAALFHAIQEERPEPLPALAAVPAPLEGLIFRALEKNRDDRMESAAEFRRELGEVAREIVEPAAVTPP